VTSENVKRAAGQLIGESAVVVESTPQQPPAPVIQTAIPTANSDLRSASESHPRTAPQLTYTPTTHFGSARWAFAGALLSVLLVGGFFLFRSYPRSVEPRVKSPNSSAPLNRSIPPEIVPGMYAAEPKDTGSGQVLTVVAQPEQTLEEIGLLYTGHFDPQLVKDICTLNPELKDPTHIEAGQLIRLPLPPGTLKKGIDTSEITSASQRHSTESQFAKIRALLGGMKW
jgi:hypothetical protein